MLKERTVQKIRYTKSNDKSGSMNRFEITERTIIPTFVPKPNIKAIDVTDLTEDQQNEMVTLLAEYNEYVVSVSKTIFKFEDWMEQTKSMYVEPKWRTFKTENTEIL